jgi:hypothetical protein
MMKRVLSVPCHHLLFSQAAIRWQRLIHFIGGYRFKNFLNRHCPKYGISKLRFAKSNMLK